MENLNITLETLIEELHKTATLKTRGFTVKLNPENNPDVILGLKLGDIRKSAAVIKKNKLVTPFLEMKNLHYLEDIMLYGIVLSDVKDIEIVDKYIFNFLANNISWSTNDVVNLTIFKRSQNYDYLLNLFERAHKKGIDNPYLFRFIVSSMMQNFNDEKFYDSNFDFIKANLNNTYYENMMVAWYIQKVATRNIEYAKKMIVEINNPTIIKMAVQKIRDSFVFTKEVKDDFSKLKLQILDK